MLKIFTEIFTTEKSNGFGKKFEVKAVKTGC